MLLFNRIRKKKCSIYFINKDLIEITKKDIDDLTKQFNEAITENNLLDGVDSQLFDLSERNQYDQQVIIMYEREIPELKKQIEELTMIESKLEKKCNFYRSRKL